MKKNLLVYLLIATSVLGLNAAAPQKRVSPRALSKETREHMLEERVKEIEARRERADLDLFPPLRKQLLTPALKAPGLVQRSVATATLDMLRETDAQSIITSNEKRRRMLDKSEKEEFRAELDEEALERKRQFELEQKQTADKKLFQAAHSAHANHKRKHSNTDQAHAPTGVNGSASGVHSQVLPDASRLSCGSMGCESTFASRETRRSHWINIHKIPNKMVSIHTQFEKLPDHVKKEALQYNRVQRSFRAPKQTKNTASAVAAAAAPAVGAGSSSKPVVEPKAVPALLPAKPTAHPFAGPNPQTNVIPTITHTTTTVHQQTIVFAPPVAHFTVPQMPPLASAVSTAAPVNLTQQQVAGFHLMLSLMSRGFTVPQAAEALKLLNL